MAEIAKDSISGQLAKQMLSAISGLQAQMTKINTGLKHFLPDRYLVEDLYQQVINLECESLIVIDNPNVKDIEALNVYSSNLKREQQKVLLSVDKLPLKLITQIMRSPEEMRNLTPRQFENFIAETLSQLGFSDVILTPRSGDGGKDIIASHQINGIPLSFYFECKKYAEGNEKDEFKNDIK